MKQNRRRPDHAEAILRHPQPALTRVHQRDCELLGFRIGRTLHLAPAPIRLKVYRRSGYWCITWDEFRIWAAERGLLECRQVFGEVAAHYYAEYNDRKERRATSDWFETQRRIWERFPLRVRVVDVH